MSEDEVGPRNGGGGASGRAGSDSDRHDEGITGAAAVKGDSPSPGGCGETSDDGQDAIDLEAARDRAS